MTLDEIRWISELFETRKMSKAAETLFVSQPALSQCLQRVEQQLGFKLFERSNKGLEPHILHETIHVFTLFRNAQAGISSSIGSCTIEAYRHDVDGSVICFVPESYKWSRSKVATYALPEIDKLLPQGIYPILRKIVFQCGVYYTGDGGAGLKRD